MRQFLNFILNRYYKDIFLVYSYFSTFGFIVLDLMPHIIRNIVFRFLLRKMGESVVIDYKSYMRYMKNIEVGDGVFINRGCQFYTSIDLGKKIIIGDNVRISPNVKFYGAAHDYSDINMSDVAEDIIIEDDCWVCANVIVLQGVTIGRGSVIGAGSIVTQNIPENSIAVGNPARVIKKRFND